MRRSVATIVALVSGATATVAFGQFTGSRLPGASTAMVSYAGVYTDNAFTSRPTSEATSQRRRVAGCLVKSRRSAVERYMLATDATERAAMVKILSPAMTGCLFLHLTGEARLSVSEGTLQGALAEALLTADRPAAKPSTPLARSSERPIWLSTDANQRAVQEMSICVADREPEKAMDFVTSVPNSDQEAQAFTAVKPFVGSCLTRGVTLNANSDGLRMALANAVYHSVNDPTSQVAATVPEKK